MSPGVIARSFDTAAVTVGAGTSFNLPLSSNQLSWGYTFSVNPASITVQLQVSFDNSTFVTIDSSTAVGGDLRTVYTAAPYVRLNISASSGGTAITGTLVAKTAPIVALPASGVQQVVIGSSDVTLLREGTGILAQRFGTQGQRHYIYRTYTDDTNFERLVLNFNTTSAIVRTENGSSGGTARTLFLSAQDNTGGGALASISLGAAGISFSTVGLSNWNIDTVGNLTSTAGAFGYATGAGGAVVQATNKTTLVALNTYTGQITLNAASLAADTTVAFTLTNAQIAANDLIVIQHISGGTLGAYGFGATAGAGTSTISVHNNTPGALAEAIVIRFAIIKSANA